MRAVEVTTANGHDGTVLPAVLPRHPAEVDADSAYGGPRSAAAVRTRGGRSRIVQTGTRGGPEALRRLEAWNAAVRRVRCRIEKVFGTWKRSYGLRRLRTI